MPTPTLTLGRQQLVFPDIGHDPGTLLRDRLRDMFSLLSDNVSARYFESITIASGATYNAAHNFDLASNSNALLKASFYDGTTGALLEKTTSTTPSAGQHNLTLEDNTVDSVTIRNNATTSFTVHILLRRTESGGVSAFNVYGSVAADIPFNDALTISRASNVNTIDITASTSTGSSVNVQNSSFATVSSSWSSQRGLDQMGGLAYSFPANTRLRSITVALATTSGTSNVRCIAISQTNNVLQAMSPTLATVTNTMGTVTFTFPDILLSGATIFAFSTVNATQTLTIGGASSGSTTAVIQNAGEAQLNYSSFVTQASIAPWLQYATTGANQNTTITGLTAPRDGELTVCAIKNSSGVLLALGSGTYNPTSANDKIALYDRDKAYILRPLETAYLAYVRDSSTTGTWKVLNDANTQIEGATVNTCTISESGIVGGLKLANAVSFTGASLKVQGNVHISSTGSLHIANMVDIDGDVFQDGALSFNGTEFDCRSMISSEKSCFQFTHAANYETPALWVRNDWLFTDLASAKNSVMLAATTLIPYIRIGGRLGFNEGTGVNDILIGVSSSSSYTDTTTAHLRSFRVGGLYDADIYCPSRTGISYFGWEFDCEGECSESTIFIENDTNLATHTLPIRIGGSVLNSTISGIGKANSSTLNAVPRGSAVTIQGNARGSTITTTGGYKSNLGAACGPVIVIGDIYNTSIAANHTATVSGGNHGAGGDVSIGGNATADSSATINTSGGPTLTSGLGGAAGNLRIGGNISSVAITCNGGSSGTSNAGSGGFINIGGNVLGSSAIASNGGASTGARGGDGRTINIIGNCEPNVTAIGGNSAGSSVGGNGATIFIRGQTSGSINTSGGTSVSGTGGSGAGIQIGYSDGGNLTTSGGNSSSAAGGTSGSVTVSGDNRASITTTGGNGGNGNGGNGGSVSIRGSHSGNGTITTRGGIPSGTGNGGAGGSVTIEGNLSTEIDSRGMAGSGSTGVGGNGGAITINGTSHTTNQHLADGGNGTGTGAHAGGTGGTILIRGACFGSISTRGGNAAGTSAAGAGGACRISGMMVGTTIETNGGSNSSSGAGGAGGQIIIDNNCAASSALTSSGGNNTGSGNSGAGANVQIRGNHTGIATITTSGGVCSGTAGNGGNGGNVTIGGYSQGACVTSGGAGRGSTGVGGFGGTISIFGGTSGNLTSSGGNSTGTGAQAGGSAGLITIYGDCHTSVTVVGTGGTAAGTSSAGSGASFNCLGSYSGPSISVSGGNNTSSGNGGNGGAITIRASSSCNSFTSNGGTSSTGAGGNGGAVNIGTLNLGEGLSCSFATCSGATGPTGGGTASLTLGTVNAVSTTLVTLTLPSGANSSGGAGGSVTVRLGSVSGNVALAGSVSGNGTTGGSYTLVAGNCNLRAPMTCTISAGSGSTGAGGDLLVSFNALNVGSHPGNNSAISLNGGPATGASGNAGAVRLYIGDLAYGGQGSTSTFTITPGSSVGGRASVVQITGINWVGYGSFSLVGVNSGITGTPGTDEYFTVGNLMMGDLSIIGSANATTNWLPIACRFKNLEIGSLNYRIGQGAGANPATNANHGKFLWSGNASIQSATLTNATTVTTIGADAQTSPATLRIYSMITKTGALWDPVAGADESETLSPASFFVFDGTGSAGSRWIAK